MPRIAFVRTLAIIFIVLALSDFLAFLGPILLTPAHNIYDVSQPIAGAFLISAGVDLFKLRQPGRKLALALIFLQATLLILFSIGGLAGRFFPQLSWIDPSLSFDLLGHTYWRWEDHFAVELVGLGWAAIELMAAVFMLQPATSHLFSSGAHDAAHSEGMGGPTPA